jgi:hypothetical protein
MQRLVLCDDTYGPTDVTGKYVTGDRRSFVAVEIAINRIAELKTAIKIWHNLVISAEILIDRFHFTDIFNRRGVWKDNDDFAFMTFAYFVQLFKEFQISTYLQTIESYTLDEHKPYMEKYGFSFPEQFFGIDTKDTEGKALMWGICQFLLSMKDSDFGLIQIDQGLKKPGSVINISDYKGGLKIEFHDSRSNSLLQFADFVAFMINRSNIIQNKETLSEIDQIFMSFWVEMSTSINCETMSLVPINLNESHKSQFEQAHEMDRLKKGLEKK